ncbi:MAG: hypothetical protein RJQ09_09990 [Cyclobacteriaceae bacterium]
MKKSIDFLFEAPYYTFGKLDNDTTTLWLACHGQGQLGEYFVKKFERFESQNHYGIVLQGLNKHYLDLYGKRIGATWMTRHDRLTDLQNQRSYFTRVFETELASLNLTSYNINLVGFSQGVSAIARLLFHLKIPFNNLVLWAGGFPPELPGSDNTFIPADGKVIVAIGDNDQYYNEKNYQDNLALIEQTFPLKPKVHIYNGDHRLDPDVLEELINEGKS